MDYTNNLEIKYRKDTISEEFETTILTYGYRDISLMKQLANEEINYVISYNITNVSGWDYYQDSILYFNDEEVLSDYTPSISSIFELGYISQELTDINKDNFNVIGNANYTGQIIFNDILSGIEEAEAIKNTYSITYTDSDEVDTIMLDSNVYSLEGLRLFFEELIYNQYKNF